ncbi:MAG: epoxyqueuosine reductase QueH [candidate division WOR-3 bacterium]
MTIAYSKKLLLHICCAICTSRVIEQLKSQFDTIGFFYNPNIEPVAEYQKRLDATMVLANYYNIPIIVGEYENQLWHSHVNEYKNFPENSIRCEICFKLRMEKTATMCKIKNIENFTTTLAASPHKNSTFINQLGQKLATEYKINFILIPQTQSYHSNIIRTLNLYRQKYCGCLFSLR